MIFDVCQNNCVRTQLKSQNNICISIAEECVLSEQDHHWVEISEF